LQKLSLLKSSATLLILKQNVSVKRYYKINIKALPYLVTILAKICLNTRSATR
jgi:hypothetical protein